MNTTENPGTTETAQVKVEHKNKKSPLRRAATTVGAVALGFVLFSSYGLDWGGSLPKDTTAREKSTQSWAKWDKKFISASPLGRFELEFTRETDISVSPHIGGKGILKFLDGNNPITSYAFGTDCLKNTPYDTKHGSHSDPADIVIPPTNPLDLEVIPQNPRLPVLNLKETADGYTTADDWLHPIGKDDTVILDTYNCKPADYSA